MRIELTGRGRSLRSVVMFGDSIDRAVRFQDGDVSALAGTPVTMEITVSDADVYSFKFDS